MPRFTGGGKDGLSKAANLADAALKEAGGPDSVPLSESWNDGYGLHAPVGSFDANLFGLHDVLGNVWEWCRDGFGSYEMKPRAGDGLRSPSASRIRVYRGASFNSFASLARSAYRNFNTPEFRLNFLGVRPARSVSNP